MTTDTSAASPAPDGGAAEPISYTCPSCGAQTAYAPGTTSLRCPSCGAVRDIAATREVVEHSYDDWAALPAKPVATIGTQVLQCRGCGATTESDLLAGACQFCGGVLVAVSSPDGLIAPEAVVPFGIDKRAADEAFVSWVRSRRFAPGALRKVGATEAITGTYIPHWTFDARTQTDYTGERGEHYWVTETYTVSDGDGKSHQETRQVQRTRWWPASGNVRRFFDDVLVPASHHLPAERLDKAGPWPLQTAVAYQPDFLAGYSALRYDVDPDVGRGAASEQMKKVIRGDCRNDIGGDEQRVHRMDVHYAAVMFKLMLLPLWIATYLYAGKSFQVVVNANTGEVIGDRPYSKLKIALAVLTGLVVAAVVVAIVLIARKR